MSSQHRPTVVGALHASVHGTITFQIVNSVISLLDADIGSFNTETTSIWKRSGNFRASYLGAAEKNCVLVSFELAMENHSSKQTFVFLPTSFIPHLVPIFS
jgi:hypothetical protein